MIKKKSKTGSRAGREHVQRTKALGVSLKGVKAQTPSRARGAAVILGGGGKTHLKVIFLPSSSPFFIFKVMHWKQDMHMQGHKKKPSFFLAQLPASTRFYNSIQNCAETPEQTQKRWTKMRPIIFFRLSCFNSGGETDSWNQRRRENIVKTTMTARWDTAPMWESGPDVFSPPVGGSLVSTSGPLPALFLTDKTHNSHIRRRPLSSEIKHKTKRRGCVSHQQRSPFMVYAGLFLLRLMTLPSWLVAPGLMAKSPLRCRSVAVIKVSPQRLDDTKSSTFMPEVRLKVS